MSRGRLELAVAGLLLAVGAFYVIAGLGIPPTLVDDPLGPRLLPQIVGGVLMGLAVVVSVTRSSSRQDSRAGLSPRVTDDGGEDRWRMRRVLGMMVVSALYALALPRLGYVPSTILMAAGALFMLSRRDLKLLVSFPVVMALLLYVFFDRFFGVQLP